MHKYAEKAEKRKDYIYAAALIWDYNREALLKWWAILAFWDFSISHLFSSVLLVAPEDMLWNQALLRQCVENYPFIVEPAPWLIPRAGERAET